MARDDSLPSPAAITALGMVTPLGAGLAASCAGIRSGMTRFGEVSSPVLTDEEGKPVRVVVSAVRGLTDGYEGLGRFTRLAADALSDLMSGSGLSARDLSSSGLYLALPPADRPGVDPRVAAEIGARLERWCGLRGVADRARVFATGHAGLVEAIAEAMRDLDSGRVQSALVGGVDSMVDAESISYFHAHRRLKTGDRPVGLVPGEGAAFALLKPPARASTIHALVAAPSTAMEPVTVDSDRPCDASGLTEAARRTLAALSDEGRGTGLVLSDLNGEPYRSEEAAYLAARAFHGFSGGYRLWHTADCIGDAGAASAAIALGIGATALGRGYARTGGALLFASSDGGLRGTLYLSRERG